MASFEVNHVEGTNYVDVHLDNEWIRAEAGALCYMTGDIEIMSRLWPSMGEAIRCILAGESVYRPTYTGTGVITLESSLGGFHVIDLQGESWILESGAYWASEGSVEVTYKRESVLTSLWAGEGFVYLQTRVQGQGKVVLCTRGPIERIAIEPGKKVVAEGKYVVARTDGVSFSIKRATKNFLGRFTAGEGFVRVFEGSGAVLLNPAPNWRYRILTERGGDANNPAHSLS